jgi:hypothetical protein
MTTSIEALELAMHKADPGAALEALKEQGFAIADQDTMSQAIHDVYCGIMADHDHPSEKDRAQAAQMLASLGRATGS